MRLKTVHVREFKSVRDSTPFEVGDVTCLVGKNESGKTAILDALYRLNPVVPEAGTFDVTDDYPRRHLGDYQFDVEDGKRKPAEVIRAVFELEDDDQRAVEETLGLKPPKTLELTKGYENTTYVRLKIAEKELVEALLGRADLAESESQHSNAARTLADLKQQLTSLEKPTEGAKKLLEKAKSAAESSAGLFVYKEVLKKRVPKFLYFSDYYQMSGEVNIEALQQRVEKKQLLDSDRPMLALVELARLDLAQLLNPDRTAELKNSLESASNHLTKRMVEYWSQNKHLHLRFDVRPARPGDPPGMQSGTNLWGDVYNDRHLATTRLGARSRGFVWFFSFLAWFSQQKRRGEPMILLLDEPGLFLHAKAQEDLLRYIELELRPTHQVIYSTHSPFMVDSKHFDRVRIVEDKSMETHEMLPPELEGTKVSTNVLDSSEDSLFPLQGALGYEIHQTLFVGPNSLVVEGVSDLLYLTTVSGFLEQEGREGLSGDWTITPVGGADKIATFVALLGSQNSLNIAVLMDLGKQTKQATERLYKRKLLDRKKVLTFGELLDRKEADLEDMFPPALILELVSEEYGISVNEENLESKDRRVLKRLEAFFKSSDPAKSLSFSHFRPARRFAESASKWREKLDDQTLNRFETLFQRLNRLL